MQPIYPAASLYREILQLILIKQFISRHLLASSIGPQAWPVSGPLGRMAAQPICTGDPPASQSIPFKTTYSQITDKLWLEWIAIRYIFCLYQSDCSTYFYDALRPSFFQWCGMNNQACHPSIIIEHQLEWNVFCPQQILLNRRCWTVLIRVFYCLYIDREVQSFDWIGFNWLWLGSA